MGLYYIPRDDYLMHHGVKGQKWGVRNDPERVGRKRSGLKTAKDVNQKKGLSTGAKIALGVGGAALAAGAGYALYKTGGAKAAARLGGKLLKTAVQKSKTAAPKIANAAKTGLKKGSIYARATAKVAGKYAKIGAQKTGSAMKKIATNTAGGVFDALKGLAGVDNEEGFFSRANIKQVVLNGGKKGLNTLSTAVISGGIVLGAKSAIRGQSPNRQEAAKWLTRNPNEQ